MFGFDFSAENFDLFALHLVVGYLDYLAVHLDLIVVRLIVENFVVFHLAEHFDLFVVFHLAEHFDLFVVVRFVFRATSVINFQ